MLWVRETRPVLLQQAQRGPGLLLAAKHTTLLCPQALPPPQGCQTFSEDKWHFRFAACAGAQTGSVGILTGTSVVDPRLSHPLQALHTVAYVHMTEQPAVCWGHAGHLCIRTGHPLPSGKGLPYTHTHTHQLHLAHCLQIHLQPGFSSSTDPSEQPIPPYAVARCVSERGLIWKQGLGSLQMKSIQMKDPV